MRCGNRAGAGIARENRRRQHGRGPAQPGRLPQVAARVRGRRMISRLDKLVLRDVALLTLVCVLGLTFLFTALSLYQIVNRFEVTPHFDTLMSFAPSLWISLLPMTLPMSALFAATLVFGRMRGERELLLLAAAGVAPWRPFVMLLPIGLITGVIA